MLLLNCLSVHGEVNFQPLHFMFTFSVCTLNGLSSHPQPVSIPKPTHNTLNVDKWVLTSFSLWQLELLSVALD